MTEALVGRVGRLRQRLDDWRVRQHFKRVEAILRDRDVSHLPPMLRQKRERYLDSLHDYAARGVFPRNHEMPGISPCFIDRDGRECAVAHLVMSSGQKEIAYEIAARSNYARVPQMVNPELDKWAAETGLSKEELTLIQPGYWYTLGDILPVVLAAWAAGLITILINARQIARRQRGIVVALIGLVVALVLLRVGYLCVDGAATAYYLGTHADGYPYDLPLQDVGPLVLGLVISVGLALVIGGQSFYKIRDFISTGRQNR